MSLEDKSKENFEVADYYINVKHKCYYAAASRIYYAVFQKIKYLLKKQRFDYAAFLLKYNMQNTGNVENKHFSHGTIQYAISEHLENQAINSEIEKFSDIDELYRVRRVADYEEETIKPQRIERNLKRAREIIDIIDKYDI